MKQNLSKQELIKKIKALQEVWDRNYELKMWEACIRNMELIHKYEYALKRLNKEDK